jgi:hypothetical protein
MPYPLPTLEWLLLVPIEELQESKRQLVESIETWEFYVREGEKPSPPLPTYEECIQDYKARLELVEKALKART